MNFPQPLLELPSFELRSSKRSQGHFLHQLSSNKTQNMKTQNKKLKKLKRLKLEREISLPQDVLFMCPPLLQEQQNNEFICDNFKKDIKVFNTFFSKNQAMKCDIEHNSINSSYKKFHFIHTCCNAK